MQKGFTLAEVIITMAIIGIIMALSIPAVIQSTNDTSMLFKKAYNTVEQTVNELINDTSLYPGGDLATGTFCTNFFNKVNVVGTPSCADDALTTFPSGVPTGTAADATTTNSMIWYNLHSTAAATATSGFTAANCDGTTNVGGLGNLTGIDDTLYTCAKILVDVNGPNKGSNISTDQANKDIFTIYVTNTGRVTVETAIANTYDEAYILRN